MKAQRFPWPTTFPEVIIQGRPGSANRHPDYLAAKQQGDVSAALRLVTDLLDDAKIEQLRMLISQRPVVLIPVYAEEAVSINRLPLAYAEVLADRLGLTVDTTIVQAAKVGRTQADGFHRLALPPPFDGIAPDGFSFAVILDDTLTQGGTLANLRGHLEAQGIQIIAATTLTGKQYSAKLSLCSETLQEVRKCYANLEFWWIKTFGYGFDHLTESEARYLLNSGQTVDTIRDRITAARQAAGFPTD